VLWFRSVTHTQDDVESFALFPACLKPFARMAIQWIALISARLGCRACWALSQGTNTREPEQATLEPEAFISNS
jgi:hypothetical protein